MYEKSLKMLEVENIVMKNNRRTFLTRATHTLSSTSLFSLKLLYLSFAYYFYFLSSIDFSL